MYHISIYSNKHRYGSRYKLHLPCKQFNWMHLIDTEVGSIAYCSMGPDGVLLVDMGHCLENMTGGYVTRGYESSVL